jgi:hypothetical protein
MILARENLGRLRRLAAVGTLSALWTCLTALTACNPNQAVESATESTRYETSAHPNVSVRLEQGSVTLIGREADEVEAVFVKRARALDANSARAFLDRIEITSEQEGDRLRFESRFESSPPVSFGLDLRTDLTLRLPRESAIDVQTGEGRIRIEGLSGKVTVETGDGRILVERATGALVLRTSDGSIVGSDLEADVDAETDDGGIELEGDFRGLRAVSSDGRIRIDCRGASVLTNDWELRTADGSISLRLTPALSADIEAVTSDGRIVNRLRSFEGLEQHRWLKGKVGNGGASILLSTMDGRIELEEH